MIETQQDLAILEQLAETKQAFSQEIGKVIIGQKDILDHMLIALLARGHSLLVGVPGLAKTITHQNIIRCVRPFFQAHSLHT